MSNLQYQLWAVYSWCKAFDVQSPHHHHKMSSRFSLQWQDSFFDVGVDVCREFKLVWGGNRINLAVGSVVVKG
jgi:hypothetical protein